MTDGNPLKTLRQHLLDTLAGGFDLDELKALAFELGLDWDNIRHSTKDEAIISMVNMLWRRRRLGELQGTGVRLRPELNWHWDDVTPEEPPTAQQEIVAILGGVNALREMARIDVARPHIIRFKDNFGDASRQIASMRLNKRIHDALQKLAADYRAINQHLPRAKTDPAALAVVIEHVAQAVGTIQEMVSFTLQALAGTEGAWVKKLHAAGEQMAAVLTAPDPAALHAPLSSMDSVLTRFPSRVNNMLVFATRQLLASNMVENMRGMGGAIQPLGLDEVLVSAFAKSLDAMEGLREQLQDLSDRHDLFQQIDDALRRIEASLAVDAGELHMGWQDVAEALTRMREPVSAGGQNALSLQALGAQVNLALAQNDTDKARGLFSAFSGVAHRRFGAVDTELLNVCNDMSGIGGSLDGLLTGLGAT
jgi:hypothetical protein